jgi:hypothetical protein
MARGKEKLITLLRGGGMRMAITRRAIGEREGLGKPIRTGTEGTDPGIETETGGMVARETRRRGEIAPGTERVGRRGSTGPSATKRRKESLQSMHIAATGAGIESEGIAAEAEPYPETGVIGIRVILTEITGDGGPVLAHPLVRDHHESHGHITSPPPSIDLPIPPSNHDLQSPTPGAHLGSLRPRPKPGGASPRLPQTLTPWRDS